MSLGKRNVLYLRVYLDFFGGACKVVKAMVRKSIRAAIFQHAMSDLFICSLPFLFKSGDDKAGKVQYYMSCDGMKKVLI